MFRFHRVGADEFEIVPKEGGDPSKPPEKWYRCGAADRAVTASVGMRDLAILTPNWSGSQTLFEVQPDISDADICQGEDHGERRRIRTLQFEALGPVHYWVFGRGFEAPRKLEFDYIRSIRKIGAHKLRLEMQEHSGSGGGWDASKPGREGKKYVLTVIERGSRIKIPELSGVFARCQAGDPVGMGMHRY